MWSREEIVEDLKKLAANGKKPDIYGLKAKYGYNLNSDFFPLLDNIRNTEGELLEFINGIFMRITDYRDIYFLFGDSCPLLDK